MVQLMEHYRDETNIFENWCWKRECFICQCYGCGNIYICSDVIRCPCCESGDIVVVPFRNCVKFNLSWLECHGFPYIEELLRC